MWAEVEAARNRARHPAAGMVIAKTLPLIRKSAMTDALPTLSLEPLIASRPDGDGEVARALQPILQTWGAFRLVDHGVAPEVIAGAFAAARLFFAQPLDARLAIKVGKHNRGYAPMHQTVYPGNLPDLKESFNLGLPLTADDPDVKANKPLHGVNVWPDLPGFRAPVEAYFDAMMTLGSRMLGPLARCFGMQPNDLRALYQKPIAFMRLFHYPPGGRIDEREHGAAEHQDYGFLTILAQDSAGGLEVRAPDNTIVAAEPRANTFIVNIGDMLAEISGGALRSAPHRVINRAGIGRYSIPFFYDPDFDARFPTLKDRSAGEFMLAKFGRFYKHGKDMAAAS
jgi:isopenicillin N synthase-like dioxygenase